MQRHLKACVRASAARIIDLFRRWDTDADALITVDELVRALWALGFDVQVRLMTSGCV